MNFPTMDSFGFGVTVTDSGGAVATGPTLGPSYPGGQPAGPHVSARLRLATAPITGTVFEPIQPKVEPEVAIESVILPSLDPDAGPVARILGQEGARIYQEVARRTPESYVQSVIRDVGETGVRIHEAEMDALRRASAADRERMIDLLAERKAQQIIAQARESEMADVGAVVAPVAEPEKKETPWAWIAAAAAGVYALTQ